jgi:hypothetical protein
MPEECKQDDDRDRNAEQPKKYASSHEWPPPLSKTTVRQVLGSGIERATQSIIWDKMEGGRIRLPRAETARSFALNWNRRTRAIIQARLQRTKESSAGRRRSRLY